MEYEKGSMTVEMTVVMSAVILTVSSYLLFARLLHERSIEMSIIAMNINYSESFEDKIMEVIQSKILSERR